MAARLGKTKEDIRQAALTVAFRGKGLTVGEVAKEAGVKPPSVYHHVAGLMELEEMVADYAAAGLREFMELDGNLGDPLLAAHRWALLYPWALPYIRDDLRDLVPLDEPYDGLALLIGEPGLPEIWAELR